MRANRVQVPSHIVPSWADLRQGLGIADQFPAGVLAEAEAVAASPAMPSLDRTDVELFTLDPAGSRDLDLAMYLAAVDRGFRVTYAIADVGAFVRPGSTLDTESRARAETMYAPDERVPMLPAVLCEGAASLLPGETRPAIVWSIDLDHAGATTQVDVRRAVVRSRQQLDYVGAQHDVDAGHASEQLTLLRSIGELLLEQASERGALSLPTPEQEVVLGAGGAPRLEYRAPLPVERWNEQISLLTGRAAAQLMLDGNVGLLRTLPPPAPDAVASLRRSALALGVAWPDDEPYGEVLSRLDPAKGHEAALLDLVPRLLRGAAYTAFDGAPPAQPIHSAIAAPYAHCTAPLRRLADRFVSEICVALTASQPVPEWAHGSLPELPELMAAADHRAHALERECVDLAEAIVLEPRVGETFPATVVEVDRGTGLIQLADPAVRARCRGRRLPLGDAVDARLVAAEPETRNVLFEAGS